MLLLSAATPSFTAPAHPSGIIWVMADDLGWGEPGAFPSTSPHGRIATPHLDTFAADAITSRATGVPIDVLARDTERSLYMDAAQALEYGIVDKIIDKVPKKDGFNVEGTLAAVARGLG